jgi:formylglycine-generating enzyme required for sulfatase activity
MNRYELSGDFRGAILNFESQLEHVIQRTGAAETPQSLLTKLRPYLETVVRRSGRLPLGPLDPSGRESAQLGLTQVFINLDAGQTVVTEASGEGNRWLHRRFSAAVAHVHHERQLVLLGDPGSGKSTLLRFLSFCLANHALEAEKRWLQKLSWMERQQMANEKAAPDVWRKEEHERFGDWRLGREETEEGEEVVRYWSADAPVPIYIELRHFAQTDFDPKLPVVLWRYVAKRLAEEDLEDAAGALRIVAQGGGVLFLLDGVDEVPVEQRKDVWQAIGSLARGPYGGNRWAATCRVLSFALDEAPVGVPFETLAQLTDEQIKRFIQSWYRALAELGELGQEQADVLGNQLQAAAKRQRLQGLARNPMLLTIMALVQTYYGALPDERAKLYQQCVETLLLRWQRHKEEGAAELPSVLEQLGTTQENLERLLWEIGWQAHRDGASHEGTANLSETEIVSLAYKHLGDWNKAGKFITYTEQRAHLLIGRGGKTDRRFTFPHRTFQEYLAACHLVSQRRYGSLAADLAAQGDAWREVLNLATGVLVFNKNDREKALDEIKRMLPDDTPDKNDEAGWRQVWLAGEMTAVIGREAVEDDKVGHEVLPRLHDMLKALLEGGHLALLQRAAAGVALGQLGDLRSDVSHFIPFMVEVSAGPFLMGSNPEQDAYAVPQEGPQHEIELPHFRIGKYAVTVAQYRHFIEAGGYSIRDFWTKLGWQWREKANITVPVYWNDPHWTIDNYPVVGVSWFEAVAYSNWLRLKTGRKFRLPDEAMWEKAARGIKGYIWPWGNHWDTERLNSRESSINHIVTVGIFPGGKSPFNLLDVSGNIWEWCSGVGYRQAPYPFKLKPYENDLDAPRRYRAIRGGSWNDFDQSARTAFRDYASLVDRNSSIGFRVAEELSDS